VLPNIISWYNAAAQCAMMGGRIAESRSSSDNQYLNVLFVVGFSIGSNFVILKVNTQLMCIMGKCFCQ
jgi:hypothetical protein